MTTARKISILFIAIALLLTGIFSALIAQRDYQHELDQLRTFPLAQLASRPDLQTYIKGENKAQLEKILEEYLKPEATSFAIMRNSQGEVLARQDKPGADLGYQTKRFKLLRGNASAADTKLLALDPKGKTVGTGFWPSLSGPAAMIHLTLPVFTSTDTSRVVIGYIHLGINQSILRKQIEPALINALLLYLAVVALLAVAVAWVVRGITTSIYQLTELTHEVTSGKRERTRKVEGGPDLQNIANMLNAVINQTKQRKSEEQLSNKILSLKVDEHSSELSKRDEELSSAAQEIDKTKRQLQKLAYYDSLTSLPNRRLFTEQLSLLLRLNQRNKSTLALLLINLENFKRINDSLGYQTGDLVLQEVAKRLIRCLRGSDTIAYDKGSNSKIDVSRIDGDEFTVVLNQLSSADDIAVVAQRLIDKLLEPIVIDGTELVVTPNMGIAISPGDANQVQGLFSAASAAMYHAKDAKQGHFLFYKPEMDSAGAERIKLESDLRKAVEHGELLLHYQPQVDTISGSVTGAEALLRWEHPELGLVPPYKFIALAEEIGLINELGDWVLVEACRQIKSFIDKGLKLPRVAINISAMQFSSRFTRRVRDVLLKANVPASMLELGLAESIMTDNDGSAIEALQDLKSKGVYLSVDDFGTSYSPMNYLSRYPLDELKIDRSFVANCDKAGGDAKLVLAIISMAESLNLKTVAEGVETEEQYRFLKNNGATVMQGYFFCKPVTAEELETMLAPWHFAEQIQSIKL